MFELKSTEETYRFDKARITIGENGDFRCPGVPLTPIHGIIEWVNGQYILENKAHDPHFLINGKPFWKRKLQDGDKLTIGHSHISYSFLSACSSHYKTQEHQELQTAPIHKADDLLLKPESKKEYTPSPASINTIEFSRAQPESGHWYLFVLSFSCLFLFAVLFSTTFYITITERAEVERLYAARGLADISMILDYVKNESIEPPFKNWLDPDFLKEIGQKIIPKDLSKFEWIDAEGHFLEASYILRLYSDTAFSRFLLIAQPVASNFQTFVQKATLVIDSENMVIKEFWKVRDLNRLLISTSGFEGIIKTEIGELIEKADSIPLDSLSNGKEKLGFKTPEELAMIDPDAIYPIYNAPRYYMIQEPIVELADKLARNPQDETLKDSLSQVLKKLEQKKGQVLYTTKGIESVIGARKIFSRKSTMLLGYLQLNSDGRIVESHLLMPNQQSWSIGAYHHSSLVTDETQVAHDPNNLKAKLHQELSSLLKAREDKLKNKGIDLINLIESHLQNPNLLFFTHFNQYFENYKTTAHEAQYDLNQSLKTLFETYVLNEKQIDLSQFLAILDEHQIDLGLNQNPEIFNKFYDASIAFEAHLNHLFEMIEDAENLDLLDSLVLVANDLINQKFPQESLNRNSWKKHLKMLCIRKLETLLWQPSDDEEDSQSYDLEWKIARILKNGYINDPEGRSFYLSHFLETND